MRQGRSGLKYQESLTKEKHCYARLCRNVQDTVMGNGLSVQTGSKWKKVKGGVQDDLPTP